MKRSIASLLAGRVRLRLLEERNLPMTLAWRTHDDILRWFFTSGVISPEQHRAWYEQYKDRDDDFVFVIEETETLKRPLDQAALYHGDWAAGRAEFGRLMIGDFEARGSRVATLATSRLVDEALNHWGLHEVYLACIAENRDALRVYERCGFRTCGMDDGVVLMSASSAHVGSTTGR